MTKLRDAALNLLRLEDAHRDAVNGLGHPGEEHDDALGHPSHSGTHIISVIGDCARCAGTQYGIEDEMNGAWGDLRAALGQERKAWEYER